MKHDHFPMYIDELKLYIQSWMKLLRLRYTEFRKCIGEDFLVKKKSNENSSMEKRVQGYSAKTKRYFKYMKIRQIRIR